MKERGIKKDLVGVVISNRMNKTAIVQVSQIWRHKYYGKYLKSHSKYLAHDPQNKCQVGDRVRITDSRPISKRKRWRVIEAIGKSAISQSEANGRGSLEQET